MLYHMLTERKFGIEIECFGISIDRAVEVLENKHIDVQYEGYSHETTRYWKIVTDSSIREGFEVVSPILSGTDGLQKVRKVANALVEANCKVDRRCGFHVHVDANDLIGADLINIVRRYKKYEDVIDSWMPKSRRGNSNQYCREMAEICRILENVSEFSTAHEVSNRILDRYYKLNVQSYLSHGTVEFRQHSGTLDWRKMQNWIQFCVNFVEDSMLRASQDETTGEKIKRNEIMLKIAEYLEGGIGAYCKTDSIASNVGIPPESVPGFIADIVSVVGNNAIGVSRTRGYSNCYCGALKTKLNEKLSQQVRQTFPEDEGPLASVHPEIARYFQQRAAMLA